ncbi:MAG: discoidin domain-containing protein [Bifidobacterium sp.]|uniref:Discoidin domain-containing protein n=1 Tax=Bifidobacterium fermentum TaxID=3059035 RepID=A0AB39UAQ9_9BIFI
MNKVVRSGAALLAISMSFALTPVTAMAATAQEQIGNATVDNFPNSPSPSSSSFDWAQRAKDYDSYVYDWSDRGSFTTISTDASALNMPAGSVTYKMPAYYGDTRVQGTSGNGNQEAVNEIASVVGASLVGIDKSKQNGQDYVDMLRTFYHPDLGVAKNSPSSASSAPGSDSIWYTTVANVLYYMLGSQYPDVTDMNSMLKSIANQYYEMLDSLGGANANITMQDYDFATHTAVSGRNEGGEAAAGAAAILLWAHAKFNDAKYLQGAEWAMEALERSNQNLYYEVVPVLAPYIAARMNAEDGTDYDISKYIGWMIGGSNVRSGWGTLTGNWGGIDVSGLVGSQTDGGPEGGTNGNKGYAFAMNSFAMPLIAATAKYDSRYASLIGRWMLNIDNASRYFYADQLTASQQYYGSKYINDPAHVIAYEGLTSSGSAGIKAMGDVPERSGSWGVGGDATSLGLYGSSWVGFMGAALHGTNVSGVLRTDLNALDFFGSNPYPTSLYYNPNSTAASVKVSVDSVSDLYDSVSNSVVARNVSESANIQIPAGESMVLVQVPAGATQSTKGSETLFDGKAVAWDRGSNRDLALDAAQISATSTAENSSASAVNDGDIDTAWMSDGAGSQSLTVDLGASKVIAHLSIVWGEEAASEFSVETSADGLNWNEQEQVTDASGGRTAVSFAPTNARYARITMTKPVIPDANGYSIRSLSVSGADGSEDLALHSVTKSSSTSSSSTTGNPSNATDGDPTTRWESSTGDPQWLEVDLGKERAVGSVSVSWETAAAKHYEIQVSSDGEAWRSVAAVTNATSPITVSTDLPSGTEARYVRIYGTSRLTTYAYSVFAFNVYAPANSQTTNPDSTAATRPTEIVSMRSDSQVAAMPNQALKSDPSGASRKGGIIAKTTTVVLAKGLTPSSEMKAVWLAHSSERSDSQYVTAETWKGTTTKEGTIEMKGFSPNPGIYTVRVTDAYGASASVTDVRVAAKGNPDDSGSSTSEPSSAPVPPSPSSSSKPGVTASSGSPHTPAVNSTESQKTGTTGLAHSGASIMIFVLIAGLGLALGSLALMVRKSGR